MGLLVDSYVSRIALVMKRLPLALTFYLLELIVELIIHTLPPKTASPNQFSAFLLKSLNGRPITTNTCPYLVLALTGKDRRVPGH